jgi:hypothetical protein
MPIASAVKHKYSNDNFDYLNKNPNVSNIKSVDNSTITKKKTFKNSKLNNNNECKEIKLKENPFGGAVMDENEKQKLIQEKLAGLEFNSNDSKNIKNEVVPTRIMKNENASKNIPEKTEIINIDNQDTHENPVQISQVD